MTQYPAHTTQHDNRYPLPIQLSIQLELFPDGQPYTLAILPSPIHNNAVEE